MKKCIACRTEKELTEFYPRKDSLDGHRNNCKICKDKTDKKYNELNKEKIKERYRQRYTSDQFKIKHKKYRDSHKEQSRNSVLIKKYGITLYQYKNMFKAQDGLCAICFNPETAREVRNKKIRTLAVDHDHVTGKVRGLLCGNCNHMIGQSKDNIETLQKAINYLKENSNAK